MEVEVSYIASEHTFFDNLKRIKDDIEVLGIDIETTGLDSKNDQITLLSIGELEWVNVYDVRYLSMELIDQLLDVISSKKLVAHNAKFDFKFLKHHYDFLPTKFHDTMLAEVIISNGLESHYLSLIKLVDKYYGFSLEKETGKTFVDNPDIIVTDDILEYAVNDVKYLAYLSAEQLIHLKNNRLLHIFDMEMDLLPVVIEMELNGVLLDKDKWKELVILAEENQMNYYSLMLEDVYKIAEHFNKLNESSFANAIEMMDFYLVKCRDKKVAYKRMCEEAITLEEWMEIFKVNVNLNSPHQMKRLLFLMGLPVDNTNSKYLKREFREHPFVKTLIEYREWTKKVTSFGENFLEEVDPATGRIFGTFDQLATNSGRFASRDPNLQNILRGGGYRNCFIAPEGWDLITADYSQIELRIVAEASQDPTMRDAFLNDIELHELTASRIFHMPIDELDLDTITKGKSANYAILYGTSAKGLAYNFGIPHSEGLQMLKDFGDTYPQLMYFIEAVKSEIIKRGYSITPFGRKRYFRIPALHGRPFFEAHNIQEKFKIWREGFNHIIQGGSADMIKLAMIDISNKNPFGDLLRIILTVHDEVVYEAHKSVSEEAAKFVEARMIEAGERFIRSIPVKVNTTVSSYWSK